MSTVITSGMRMPAPAACTRRPSSSTAKLGPQPASALPAVKMTRGTRKSRFVVKRSVRNAVMGIMMALTRVKPVVSHCAVEASTLISAMTDGRAGATTVWFRTVTNVPNTRTASMTICLRDKPIYSVPSDMRREQRRL